MSYRDIHIASDSMFAVVKDLVPTLADEAVYRLVEAIEAIAAAHADQAIDRLFNRGDFR
jgi:hypothetical protein